MSEKLKLCIYFDQYLENYEGPTRGDTIHLLDDASDSLKSTGKKGDASGLDLPFL